MRSDLFFVSGKPYEGFYPNPIPEQIPNPIPGVGRIESSETEGTEVWNAGGKGFAV